MDIPDDNPLGQNATSVTPDASELILCTDKNYSCETYIFEPSDAEKALGHLYAVGETESRDGVGSELLDLTIQAMQREYYRDPSRGILASFESALHQANLVLYDTSEQGVREWMGYFHVAVCVLAGMTLHLTTAGSASVFIARKSRTTNIAKDLSYSPITNPLRSFAQVASGNVGPGDTLFLGTSNFGSLFRSEDMTRFAIDHSATTITTRLQQLYNDQRATSPVSIVTISLLPQQTAIGPTKTQKWLPDTPSRSRNGIKSITPRQPLIIHQSWLKTTMALAARMVVIIWQFIVGKVFPLLIRGSHAGSKLVVAASAKTGKNVHSVTKRKIRSWQTKRNSQYQVQSDDNHSTIAPPSTLSSSLTSKSKRVSALASPGNVLNKIWGKLSNWIIRLPKTSKIFAILSIFFATALVTSLLLLQSNRAQDAQIQRASEILHDARTKHSAADTALIYDNRDQARQLLIEANQGVEELLQSGLYIPEATQLRSDIEIINDRLQKVSRASTNNAQVVGDFAELLEGEMPTSLTMINGSLYTFNPKNNAIIKMNLDGSISVVVKATQGIGFFSQAIANEADKIIIFLTDAPGLAQLDTKNEQTSRLDIVFNSSEPNITAAATFGNRFYLYDKSVNNIISYSRTLTGFSGANQWITDQDFPSDSIISMIVDGSIYTLHSDGSIRRLFKGEEEQFTVEPIDPPITSATQIYTTENAKNFYVSDPSNHRVVSFTKKGLLVNQYVVDIARDFIATTVSPDETTLYVLDGTRVITVPLN